MADSSTLAGFTGHRGASGVGLQIPGRSEPGAIVSDFGEDPSLGEYGQTGKARDDLCIGMLEKEFRSVTRQVFAGSAGRVELSEPADHWYVKVFS